jgi:hypothetical protein
MSVPSHVRPSFEKTQKSGLELITSRVLSNPLLGLI